MYTNKVNDILENKAIIIRPNQIILKEIIIQLIL